MNNPTTQVLFGISLFLGIIVSIRTLTLQREEEANRERIKALEDKVETLESLV